MDLKIEKRPNPSGEHATLTVPRVISRVHCSSLDSLRSRVGDDWTTFCPSMPEVGIPTLPDGMQSKAVVTCGGGQWHTSPVSRCRAPVALRHRTSSTPTHAPQHDSIMQSSSEHNSYAACERSGCEPALHGMEVAGGESPRRDKRATREISSCKLRLKGLYLNASGPSRHQ